MLWFLTQNFNYTQPLKALNNIDKKLRDLFKKWDSYEVFGEHFLGYEIKFTNQRCRNDK